MLKELVGIALVLLGVEIVAAARVREEKAAEAISE